MLTPQPWGQREQLALLHCLPASTANEATVQLLVASSDAWTHTPADQDDDDAAGGPNPQKLANLIKTLTEQNNSDPKKAQPLRNTQKTPKLPKHTLVMPGHSTGEASEGKWALYAESGAAQDGAREAAARAELERAAAHVLRLPFEDKVRLVTELQPAAAAALAGGGVNPGTKNPEAAPC